MMPASHNAVPRYLARSADSDETTAVICHEYAVPAYIEPELEQLYQNIFSSLSHFKAYGGLTTDTCTYIARENGKTEAIFLFRRIGRAVLVLNEGMKVDEKSLHDFAHYVFSRWQETTLIMFQAVQAQFETLSYPVQRHECTAQVTMPLPATEEAYLASLGKNMRRNIRRYLKRLQQDHPDFEFQLYGPQQISREQLQEIFRLSRTRITGLNRSFALDDEEEKIFDLARMRGLVGVATIGGKVCGGMIGFRAGDTYFAKVLGHDAAYKDYSLGVLCCYLMAARCIELGCREFNFMWNEYPYKTALGGRRHSLERLIIYRSRMQRVRNSTFAARVAMDAWRFKVSSLLDKEDMQETLSPKEKIHLQALLWMRKCWRRLRPAKAEQGERT